MGESVCYSYSMYVLTSELAIQANSLSANNKISELCTRKIVLIVKIFHEIFRKKKRHLCERIDPWNFTGTFFTKDITIVWFLSLSSDLHFHSQDMEDDDRLSNPSEHRRPQLDFLEAFLRPLDNDRRPVLVICIRNTMRPIVSSIFKSDKGGRD